MHRWLRYALLTLIVFGSAWVRSSTAIQLIRVLGHPAAYPSEPFSMRRATREIGGGPFRGDQILAIDGRPLRSFQQYQEIVFAHHPGDLLRLTLSKPSGEAFETSVEIPSNAGRFDEIGQEGLAIALDILLPLAALFFGAFVVFIRPFDRNAWLLFLMLVSYCELAVTEFGPESLFHRIWSALGSAIWPVLVMLFGIYFPERAAYDLKRPWLKLVLLIPSAALGLAYAALSELWVTNLDAVTPWQAWFGRLYLAQTIVAMIAIGSYFAGISIKSSKAPSADSRRRLKILYWGSCVSLTPVFLLGVWSLVRGRNLLVGVPWILVFVALMFLMLFPLVLAYVIVVERAMDLRFVIRQSIQYAIAKAGFRAIRAALVLAAVYIFVAATIRHTMGGRNEVELLGSGIGLIVLRRKNADRASEWIDRKFFRESYNSEKVLSDLAREAARYVEVAPLLETVAARISTTLHVSDLVVLLREGDSFVTRYSTRPGEPMSLASEGQLARVLLERNQALEVQFDKPPAWLRTLTGEELQALDFMRTQLLLPLTANNKLTGALSLGPKRSEAPYSETDIRLLETVASQMSLALENSRLVATLASEAAAREIANRELEIAREVQERLFPQSYPSIPGLDCSGYCRPARGVGGDYYDFLQLEDGRLGIAIGDVSGKGIAAALLMASLQASLRGQATAGLRDLSSLMHNVNRLVYEASTSNRYATFFYGEYDPATCKLSFVNAGHNPPVILRGYGVLRLEAGGPVVGLLPTARYGQDECQLRPGDIFVAFTDGISEAMNESEEEWEEDRFIASAQACDSQSAKDMIQCIFRDADRFTGSAKQYDDMTLLVIKLSA